MLRRVKINKQIKILFQIPIKRATSSTVHTAALLRVNLITSQAFWLDRSSAAWLRSFAQFTQPVVQPAVKCKHRVSVSFNGVSAAAEDSGVSCRSSSVARCVCGVSSCFDCRDRPHWPAACHQSRVYDQIRQQRGASSSCSFLSRDANLYRICKKIRCCAN